MDAKKTVGVIPLEVYAGVRAHLTYYEDSGKSVVLSVLDVALCDYDNSDGHWSNEFVRELRGKRPKLRPRYDHSYREELGRLEREALTLSEVAMKRRPPEDRPEGSAEPRRPLTPPPAITPAPHASAGGPGGGSPGAASPWTRGDAPSFALQSATRAGPPAAQAPAITPIAPMVDATAQAALVRSAPTPAPAPSPPAAPARKGGTMALPAFPSAGPVELPFGQLSHEEVMRNIEAAAARSPLPPPPEDSLGATVAATGPASSRPLPFAETALPLTLQQYASLFVELRTYASAEADVLARYGLASRSAFRHIEDGWKARFELDSALRSTWIGMCHTYRAWLSKNPRY